MIKCVGWLTVLVVFFFSLGWFFDWTSLAKENGSVIMRVDGCKIGHDLQAAVELLKTVRNQK